MENFPLRLIAVLIVQSLPEEFAKHHLYRHDLVMNANLQALMAITLAVFPVSIKDSLKKSVYSKIELL